VAGARARPETKVHGGDDVETGGAGGDKGQWSHRACAREEDEGTAYAEERG